MVIYLARQIKNVLSDDPSKIGRIYIGKHQKSLESRINKYKTQIAKGPRTYFENCLAKYGFDSFKFEVIDTAKDKNELCEKEKYWIKFYDSMNREGGGINQTSGGERGFKRSKEQVERNSRILKEKYASGEIVPYWLGKEVSQERREKQSKTMKKTASSKEYRQMLSLKAKEGLRNPIVKEHLSKVRQGKRNSISTEFKKGQEPWNKGRIWSEEIRQKIRNNRPMRKPVLCIEDDLEFVSQEEAGRQYKVAAISIKKSCINNRKIIKIDKQFKYIDKTLNNNTSVINNNLVNN